MTHRSVALSGGTRPDDPIALRSFYRSSSAGLARGWLSPARIMAAVEERLVIVLATAEAALDQQSW